MIKNKIVVIRFFIIHLGWIYFLIFEIDLQGLELNNKMQLPHFLRLLDRTSILMLK